MFSSCPDPFRRLLIGALAALTLAGCSDNALTGRRQLAFVSDEQLAQMADQPWAEMRAQTPVLRDPEARARVMRVMQPIIQATGRSDLDWEVVVFDSPQVNAFVLPNGKVGVFRGLLELVGSDDELAAVLGHEAAHILARHPAERVSQELATQAGVTLAQLVFGGENGENAEIVAGVLGLGATYGVLLPYSRSHELEADRLGVELMRKAGFKPQAAVRFWERMIARQARQGAPPEALSTHPGDERRLAELRKAVA